MPTIPRNDENKTQEQGITSPPPEQGHKATTPPSNPERDEEAAEHGVEELEKAGGGH